MREESALNMFRQMDLKGKAKDDTQLKTVHQNTISTVRSYEEAGGALQKFSSKHESTGLKVRCSGTDLSQPVVLTVGLWFGPHKRKEPLVNTFAFQMLYLMDVECFLDSVCCLWLTLSIHTDKNGDSSGRCFGSASLSKDQGPCRRFHPEDKDLLSQVRKVSLYKHFTAVSDLLSRCVQTILVSLFLSLSKSIRILHCPNRSSFLLTLLIQQSHATN